MSHGSVKLSSSSNRLTISLTIIIAIFQLQMTLTSTSNTMEASSSSSTAVARQADTLNKSSQAVAPAMRQQQHHHQEVEMAFRSGAESQTSGWTERNSPAHKHKRREQHGRVYRIRAAGANGSFSSTGQLDQRPPVRDQDDSNGASIERSDTGQQQQFGVRQRAARLLTDRNSATRGSQDTKTRGCDQPVGEQLASGETTTVEASSISASSQTLRLNSRPSGGNSAPSVVVLRPMGVGGEQNAAEPDESTKLTTDQAAASRQQTTSDSDGQTPIDPLTRSRESSILSLIDEFDSKITTNRTQAQLACDSGEMVVRLNFTQPFKGIVYPEHNRLSPCRFFGDGHHNYELRLPLRGCGTKQVAPRVFVNDVIVRFHKTLELEEDEVKTLICRYPAPLDASQRERERLAAANGLVHELAHATSNRSQLEQFELFEPSAGATKTNRFGQQELFGELLAPPSAIPSRHHNNNNNNQLSSQTLQELQQRQRTRQHGHADLILAPPLGATKSQPATNSRLFEGIEPLGGDTLQSASSNGSSAAGGFLDRLTSIELLFLISSLVFLALLALGLLLSYWCFWRRRRDARRNPLAGAPTSGTRRKLRYFNAPHLTATNAAGATGTRPLFTPTRHYSIDATPTSLYQQARQQQQQQQQQHQQPAALYYQQQPQYLSQQQMGPSSPDDSDVSGRVLLPPAGSQHPNLMLNQRVPMRRAARQHDDQMGSQHYKASTIARYQAALPAAIGRRGRPNDVMTGAMSQTLGRRAQQEYRSGGYLGSNLRRTSELEHGQQVTKANTLNVHSSSREPLLKMATPRLPDHRTQHDDGGHLRAANSAQQLNCERPTELIGWQKHQKQLDRFRNEHEFRQRAPVKPHEYQEQEAFVDYKHSSKRVRQLAPGPARLVDINSSSSSPSSSAASPSEGELVLNNGNNSQSVAEPRLVLKSIEDSFVTNFTEIREQEYQKYDNRRPLSLAEWRAKQPPAAMRTSEATGSGASLQRQRANQRHQDEGASSSDSERDREMASTNLSTTAGLRSLTELDVNFAKSLPRPQRGANTLAQQQTNAPAAAPAAAGQQQRAEEKKAAPVEAPSPDLIISPDYNFGRFKLVDNEPAGPSRGGGTRNEGAKTPGGESHESISYV